MFIKYFCSVSLLQFLKGPSCLWSSLYLLIFEQDVLMINLYHFTYYFVRCIDFFFFALLQSSCILKKKGTAKPFEHVVQFYPTYLGLVFGKCMIKIVDYICMLFTNTQFKSYSLHSVIHICPLQSVWIIIHIKMVSTS